MSESEPTTLKTKMNLTSQKPFSLLTLGTTLVCLASSVTAQPSAHYVPGVEGIKGASLPPPGIYFRDYNVVYFSDRLNNNRGNEIIPADPSAFIYANVPRVLWITDKQVLGGFLGVDGLLPLQYTDLKVNTPGGPFKDSTFGIGDFFAEGTWSKHIQQFDFSLAYGIWAPTGDSAKGLSTRAGLGFWTHMLTAGATWYADADKKWAVSALSRYEISHEKEDTSITPGQVYTLEWGASYSPKKTMDFGLVGYFQTQTTRTTRSGPKADVVGVGPEINGVLPKLGIIASLRYEYEVAAANRLQGNTIALTLTKRF